MLFRRKDFHGGRAYAADPSEKGTLNFGTRASLMIAWVKLQLSRLTPDASRSVPQGLSRRKGKGFSLLGSDQHHPQLRELDTKVFPMPRRRRDAAKALGQVSPCE